MTQWSSDVRINLVWDILLHNVCTTNRRVWREVQRITSMTLTSPNKSARVPRPLIAAVTGVLLAVVTVAAQSGIFNEVYEGELFGVQQILEPLPGYAAGVAYLNDTLYIADGESESPNLIVRDASVAERSCVRRAFLTIVRTSS